MLKTLNEQLHRLSVDEFKSADKLPVVVVLDNIRSQSNVGSFFRTCDAFRIKKLFLCGITATPPHREIQKTALGATESVDWEYAEQTADCVNTLRSQGYTIVSVEQVQHSCSLTTFRFSDQDHLALVFGNELNGVDQEIIDLSHNCLEIPQSGTKHSLNVAVAGGIVLWHVYSAFIPDSEQAKNKGEGI